MSFNLTHEQAKFLIKLAREAVEEYLKNGTVMRAPEDTPPTLLERYGVFVTLNRLKKGRRELRGCIGFMYPTSPLAQAVIESAINSATQDPRFYPVSLDELDHILFEVSVLTPPQLIKVDKPTEYPLKFKVGKDGLVVERGPYKGLLLPQVPVELNWEEEEFICQCCIKAGLSPDIWLLKGTKIYKFSCVIVKEISPKGDILVKDMRKSNGSSSSSTD